MTRTGETSYEHVGGCESLENPQSNPEPPETHRQQLHRKDMSTPCGLQLAACRLFLLPDAQPLSARPRRKPMKREPTSSQARNTWIDRSALSKPAPSLDVTALGASLPLHCNP
eukprot:4419087-Pleurochrysis_carterae.AAC.6